MVENCCPQNLCTLTTIVLFRLSFFRTFVRAVVIGDWWYLSTVPYGRGQTKVATQPARRQGSFVCLLPSAVHHTRYATELLLSGVVVSYRSFPWVCVCEWEGCRCGSRRGRVSLSYHSSTQLRSAMKLFPARLSRFSQ